MSEFKIKPAGKIAAVLVVAGLAFGAYQLFSGGKGLGSLIPSKQGMGSVDVETVPLPTVPTAKPISDVGEIGMPSDRVAAASNTQVRWLHWAWNAHMGLMFANGGPETTVGSLMAGRGVNLKLTRQDDAVKMQEALVAFAQELKNGNPQPRNGAHFVSIMGDGSAVFLAAVNETLAKLGPEYKAKIVGSAGFSRGEDKFMGPESWKNNPRKAMGGVVSGYLRDGDWNIAQKWLGDNGLRNNTDEKTYDPDALNWVAANDYIDAAEKYIAGYSEERPVVKNGKRTGETKRITVEGVVTWTPGDVSVAMEKGGLVNIVSTREYSAQMPCVIIGIDKWMKDNRSIVENMLEGISRGSDAVKSSEQALDKASEISAKCYGEKDAAYWKRYFKGVVEKDKQGNMVELGGSSVNNIADSLLLFGLAKGTQSAFEATYTVFGDIVKKQYPDLVPSYPPVSEILDTSYMLNVAQKMNLTDEKIVASISGASIPKPTTDTSGSTNKPKPITVGTKNWDIKFATGQAAFTGTAATELNKLLKELLIAGNTFVEIHGHTDNVGNADANYQLSEARAFAVKNWLEKKAPAQIKGRVKVVAHGQTSPLVPNDSDGNRAKNRRVEIILKSGG